MNLVGKKFSSLVRQKDLKKKLAHSMLKYKTILLCVFFGILLCIPVILPYFSRGFFPTHDGEWAVVRAGEMFREIRDNQFPPRYSGVLNFGYGYPLFNFAYPLPYYLATILHLLKFGFVDSIKIIFASSVFVSFFGMYCLSKAFWKSTYAGLLSAILYIYLPYRLVDLYVRGSIGESIAFALFPLIFLCAVKFIKNPKKLIFSPLLAFLVAALILSHNIMAVYMLMLFGVFFLAVLIFEKRASAFLLLSSFVWGFFLSSFFWVPALFEKNNILLSVTPIADRNLYFVKLNQLIVPSWGYGTPTDANPFTYNLGIPQVIGFILVIFILGVFWEKHIKNKIFIFFAILTIVLSLMMFSFSSIFWKLPLLSEINYTWTLLLPIGFLMTFLTGLLSFSKKTQIIGIVLIVLAVILSLPNAHPSTTVNRGDSFYLTNEATTTSSNELMPLWVNKIPAKRFDNKIETSGQVTNLFYSSNKISFEINTSKKELVTVNQIYYPGWRVYVDGKEAKITYKNPMGVMQFQAPLGDHVVLLRFTETKTRIFADLLSLLSLLSLCVYMIILLKKSFYISKKQKG